MRLLSWRGLLKGHSHSVRNHKESKFYAWTLNLRALWMVVAATCVVSPCFGQSSSASEEAKIRLRSVNEPAICGESRPESGVKAALRLVCVRQPIGTRNIDVRNAIVIGFVGGFVRHDDVNHPEVEFAALLRESYPSDGACGSVLESRREAGSPASTAAVGHDAMASLRTGEEEQARIIIYGHSWGGSQAVTLARS